MRMIAVLILFLSLCGVLAAQLDDQSLIGEAPIEVERIEAKEHEAGVTTVPGHKITSALPESIALVVQKLTGIRCDDISATVRLMDENNSFRVLHFTGSGFAAKGESRIGKEVLIPKHDYEYSFKQIFQISNSDTFISEGAFEFNNKLTDTRVYAVCRVRAKRNANGSFSGNSEWIGPIDITEPNASRLSSIFAESEIAGK